MEAYKPYVDYILRDGIAQTAYVLTREGVLCGSNLPITQMPKYQFQMEDENDSNKKHKMIVDEKSNLLEAIKNKGVCKNKAGIRIYNQKYFHVRNNFDEQASNNVRYLYLKKHEGGGCICLTKNFIIIGTWNGKIKKSNGVFQNPGELNKRVQALALDLTQKGY